MRVQNDNVLFDLGGFTNHYVLTGAVFAVPLNRRRVADRVDFKIHKRLFHRGRHAAGASGKQSHGALGLDFTGHLNTDTQRDLALVLDGESAADDLFVLYLSINLQGEPVGVDVEDRKSVV